jgi:GNAT superfamily N-acetyltransferase
MAASGLDNPFWTSLQTRHRGLALTAGRAARYPADHAPFIGVEAADADVGDDLRALIQPGETLLLLGVLPPVPDGFRIEPFADLAQMECTQALDVIDGPAVIELADAHRADVLALTARVYPHYFRPRTMELGRYFGIYERGRLAAMAGERLGSDTHQEISAICTDPDYTGRGYARRLTALLSNDNLARGRTPFLHVSHANTRAKAMYQRIGFHLRRDIGFGAIVRE